MFSSSRTLLAPFAGSLLLISAVVLPLSVYAQSTEKGAYIDQARFIHYPDETIALEAIKSGDLDAYYFRMPNEIVQDSVDDPRIKIYEKISGSSGILINPAPAGDNDSINPFSFKQVRFAMNYLIDREFIVNEVMKGQGVPLVDPFGVYSPEYPNVIDAVESFGFRYNPSLANSLIEEALAGAGAEKENDKWMFNGKPVTVKILIRSDDPARKAIGEVISSSLEGVGLTVEKEFGDLLKANTVVYGSNPQDFQWHLYTEGFAGTSVFVRYNPLVVGQMYGPWYGALPGGQNPTFWRYENQTLDEITQRIFFFNFTSENERNDLVSQAVEMGIEESVRIFLVQKIEPFVTSSEVSGWVNDFGAGITSKYSLVNAMPSDGRSSVDIGVKQIYQGAWNGVGGYNDAYNRDIFFLIYDSATFRHPFTGEIIPVRTEWTEIVTEGPVGSLDVPSDVQLWDPVTSQWRSVGDESAKSKVSYKILYSNWHHGVPMDKADLIYPQYFVFEWGTDEGEGDVTVDSEYTSQAAGSLPLNKGFKFTANDMVESYIDLWHYDEKEIADSGAVWAAEPWEISAAVERLVAANKFAYSRTESTAKDVDWISLIIPSHAEAIKDELQMMKSEGFVPQALKDIVTPEQAVERYDASIKWISEHKHAVISNGPFYVDNYNIEGRIITIKAFRDSSYPFEQGHWSYYQDPQLAKITKVDAPKSFIIGQPSGIDAFITVGDAPSNEVTVNYFVSDSNGKVMLKGEGKPSDTEGKFEISLGQNDTALLSPGPNIVKIFASSKSALRPDISTITIIGSGGNATTTPTDDQAPMTSPTETTDQPSGCLIATAAFGSELTPQVQYLRSFRENYILSTASGSAFMDTFNSVYYSFSPQVADYERSQPWLQQTVKAGIYPLFWILTVSEKSYLVAGGGELGSIVAGFTAASLIGAVYLSPAAAVATRSRSWVRLLKVLVVLTGAVVLTILAGVYAVDKTMLLPLSTAAFVLLVAATSAVAVALAAKTLSRKFHRRQTDASRK